MALQKIIIIPLLCHSAKSPVAISNSPFINLINSRSFSEAPANHGRNLVAIFQRYGFSSSEIPNFLKKNEFLLTRPPAEVEISLKIISSLNLSQDFIISTIIGCPSLLHIDFLKKWQLGITQLGVSNITPDAIRNLLEMGRKYHLTPEDVSKRVRGLMGLGLSEHTIAKILKVVPIVIMSKEDQIQDKVKFLMGIGIQRKEIDRVFGLFPEITAFGVETRLKPLIDEFRDLGFNLSEIRGGIVRDPKILSFENGELAHCMEMLRSLKCRKAIKENIYRDGEFRAGYEVKRRVDCLRRYGLTYRDAFTVMWKEPRVVLYEMEDIEEKIEFLICKMKFGVECLVEVPEYLGVSFENRIVPRWNVIEHLRSCGGLGDKVGLRNVVKLSRLRFYNMYVKPYPECEKMYGRFGGDGAVRSCHPVGLWKLFRPLQYQASGQDVENIKAFMKSLP